MLKRIPLAADESAEIDEFILQRNFVFSLQIASIKGWVICTETIIDSLCIKPLGNLANRGQVGKRPSV